MSRVSDELLKQVEEFGLIVVQETVISMVRELRLAREVVEAARALLLELPVIASSKEGKTLGQALARYDATGDGG